MTTQSTPLFVYCPVPSDGARGLVQELGAIRLRNFDGMDFWSKGKKLAVPEGSAIINWGGRLPNLDGIRVLNGGHSIETKLQELQKLAAAAVKVPTFYTKLPKALYGAGPEVVIPRRLNHMGGRDILDPPQAPAFWTARMKFVSEYRLHSFNGKSIKAGIKTPRNGFTLAASEEEWKSNPAIFAHPWWRSFDTGWLIAYREFKSSEAMRKTAAAAIKALGLTFGGVDLALDADDQVFVLEVNKAPGIEGTTINAYVKAIQKWVNKTEDESIPEPAISDNAPVEVHANPAGRRVVINPDIPGAMRYRPANFVEWHANPGPQERFNYVVPLVPPAAAPAPPADELGLGAGYRRIQALVAEQQQRNAERLHALINENLPVQHAVEHAVEEDLFAAPDDYPDYDYEGGDE